MTVIQKVKGGRVGGHGVYMNNTGEKWLFWISQSKVATSDRWGGGQICKMFTSSLLGVQHTKII